MEIRTLWHALHINRLLIHFLITGITTTGESFGEDKVRLIPHYILQEKLQKRIKI